MADVITLPNARRRVRAAVNREPVPENVTSLAGARLRKERYLRAKADAAYQRGYDEHRAEVEKAKETMRALLRSVLRSCDRGEISTLGVIVLPRVGAGKQAFCGECERDPTRLIGELGIAHAGWIQRAIDIRFPDR